MRLRNIEFGSVFNASGARNFFGNDAYWFHHLLGLNYAGCTIVSKTTTLEARPGFMPLKPNSTQPIALKPKCIIVNHRKGIVLNKVGLSGWGLDWLLKQGTWQAETDPFVISVMAIGPTKAKRLTEYAGLAERLAKALPDFLAPIALQINFSCPNVGHDQSEMADEVVEALAIFAAKLQNTPFILKFNALLEIDKAVAFGRHERCDAIVMGNTIPWGQLPDRINWPTLFGSMTSPLAGLGGDPGGGGLSGAPLLPIHVDWIKAARAAGFKKPIVACGGILHMQDVRWLKDVGASAIELGSVSILRPWRVQSIINEGRKVFG
jgi:dihydroorotate dehydrogenase